VDEIIAALEAAIWPSTPGGQIRFLGSVTLIFLSIHVCWDALSQKTAKFSLSSLSKKMPQLMAATSFATGLVFVLALFDHRIIGVIGDLVFPTFIAGMASCMIAIGHLSPHEDSNNSGADNAG
jgi:hypothetical protein